jgi:uncharacterized protein
MDKVQHFEIPAANVLRAKTFYSDTFGWNVIDIPNMDYTMFHTGKTNKKGMIKEKGVINGGMMKKSGKLKSPIITITVDSIEESIAKIKKNGGKIVINKMAAGDMGFTAYFEDSEGNIMGLWQNARKMM